MVDNDAQTGEDLINELRRPLLHANSTVTEHRPKRKRIAVKVLAKKDMNYANCGQSYGGSSI